MSDAQSLQLRVRADDDFLFVEKLSGFNTHAPDIGKTGIFELLKAQTGEDLAVVHRLDKETSGALIFARNKAVAADVGQLFESQQVKKRYLFLTDRKHRNGEFEIQSFIDKRGTSFVSQTDTQTPNARTRFRRLQSFRKRDLWEAFPATGKPHQIRLHAADAGIPILGDQAHGGSPFFRLCLHSRELHFPWKGGEQHFETANPVWVNDLDDDAIAILDTVHGRSQMFDLGPWQDACYRLIHQETEFCRIDHYGPQLWVSWYRENPPSPADLKTFEFLSKTMGKPVFIRAMKNRGKDPNAASLWRVGTPHDRWTAIENGVKYEMRSDQGLSPGLFLDQRENRRWVRTAAKGKKVLNLFSYTGGFSLNAALAGATEVCTVDVSAVFNDWAAENFRLNGLNASELRYEWWAQDCLLFMKGALKRRRKWDLILCDPPSFGRSREGVFQIHKNLPELLELCLSCLDRGGQLLLSSNYEEWSLEDLMKQVFVYRTVYPIEVRTTPPQGLDFERPDETPLMKSLIVERK